MSHRPQSPSTSSYVPQSPANFTTSTYRPQSPDLSGLGNPDFDSQYPPRNALTPGYSNTYRGPTAQPFPSTSIPQQQQPYYSQQPFANSYAMPPTTRATQAEDADPDYLPTYPPDTPATRRARRQPQQQYEPSTASFNGAFFPQPQQQPVAANMPPSDPTLGVTLKTSFPVARIKRIMQADEDIGKVAQVTPHVVSRALELFMIKLISASSEQARSGSNNASSSSANNPGAGKGPKRVLAQHMKAAVKADDTFDFLAEIIAKVPDAPQGRAKKESAGGGGGGSDSEEVKPKRKGKKRKDSGDDL